MKDSNVLLMGMALLFGIRHGFDLDHLATIDALTRMVSHRKMVSKAVGVLFSLGHGVVVISMSLLIGAGFMSFIPVWLDGVGEVVSISCLLLFGGLTFWTVLFDRSEALVSLGLKSILLQKMNVRDLSPWAISLIGMLFAFSFDTLSQMAFFSLSGHVLSGVWFSMLLGFFFMLGMIVADGMNGWLVSILIRRTNQWSFFLSRILGLLIACFSVLLGVINLYQFVLRV